MSRGERAGDPGRTDDDGQGAATPRLFEKEEWRAALHALAPRALPAGTSFLLRLLPLVLVAEWVVLIAFGGDVWRQVFQLERDGWLRPWTILLNLVAHLPLSIGHIGSNMLGIWLVAPYVERRLGLRAFLVVFFVCGIVAAALQVALFGRPALGASGGVTAIIGSALVLSWGQAWSWRWTPVNPLRVLALAVVIDSVSGLLGGPSQTGDVAHLSGLLLGIAATFAYRRRGSGLRFL